MGFGAAIRTCLSKYVTFSGRASRPEYWYFFLFLLAAELVAGVIDWSLFGTTATLETETGTATVAAAPAPVQSLVSLALFLPHLTAAWRRMHDTGRSGWFVLLPSLLGLAALAILLFGIGLASHFAHGGSLDILFTRATVLILIPTGLVMLVSPLLVFWWLTRPSQPGANAYGPNPHEVTS